MFRCYGAVVVVCGSRDSHRPLDLAKKHSSGAGVEGVTVAELGGTVPGMALKLLSMGETGS